MNLFVKTNCVFGILDQQCMKQKSFMTHKTFFYLRNNVSKTYFKIFNIHMKICFLKWWDYFIYKMPKHRAWWMFVKYKRWCPVSDSPINAHKVTTRGQRAGCGISSLPWHPRPRWLVIDSLNDWWTGSDCGILMHSLNDSFVYLHLLIWICRRQYRSLVFQKLWFNQYKCSSKFSFNQQLQI